MNKNAISILTALLMVLVWSACKKSKKQVELPPPVLNSPELITSMVIQFKDSADASTTLFAEFRDPDGPGGNAHTKFDTIRLAANKTYLATVFILDETKNPIDTVSKELASEGHEHIFCFTPSGASAQVFVTDKDKNNLPVGLLSKWRTGSTGTGTMRIVLKHQTNGTKDGSCTQGETDIDLSFATIIQ